MLPSQRPDQSVGAIPAEIRARVMEAALDELTAGASSAHLDAAMIYGYWGDRHD